MPSRIVLPLILYGWLLGPRLVALDIMWLFVAALLLMAPLLGAAGHVIGGEKGLVWLLAVTLALYSLAIPLLHGVPDFAFALAWLKAFVYALSGVSVVLLYRRGHRAHAAAVLLRHLVLCGAISALLSLIIFLNPALRAATGELIVGTIANSLAGQHGFRIFDLSIGGGTGYGLFNLVLCIVLYRYPELFSRPARAALYALFAATILLSARSVLVVALMMALGAGVAHFRFDRALRGVACGIAVAVPAGLLLWGAVMSGALAGLANAEQFESFVDNTLPWLFEVLYNFAAGEGLRSGTTDYMAEEFFFPDSLSGRVFGTGDFEPASDSGLVRTVFAVGVFGLALQLLLVALFLRSFLAAVADHHARTTLVSVALLLLLFNFKEITFSNGRGLFGLWVLLYYGLMILPAAGHAKFHAQRFGSGSPAPAVAFSGRP